MPWTKLKNIILLVLALANLFLLTMVVSQELQDRQAREQTWQGAVRFLTQQGVQVEERVIPQTMELSPQTVRRDLEGERAAARALLGGEVSMEALGGEVYRYYNDSGSIQFHSYGAFSAQLEPAAFPVEGSPAQAAQAALSDIGFQGELLEEKEGALVFRQTWAGAPLFNQEVTVTCSEEGLTALENGHRLVGEPREDPSRRTISVSTALVSFLNGVSALGDVCSRMDAIQPGYAVTPALSGGMTLTPVWRVTTDTGAYQLDTVTGQVTRLE